jgi:CRISPR/Cas system-associated exonuclease Cas4 (RecB family)
MKLKVNEHLALGNSMHHALETAYKEPEWSLDFASRTFLTEYRRSIEQDEVFVTWPKMKKAEAEALEMLERHDHGISEGRILFPAFAVEKEFLLPFEGIEIVGKIDRIDQTPGGYLVSDYKTSKREPDAWFLRHDLQLTAYAWACQQLYGELPVKLYWIHLRNGKWIETERTQQDVDDLKTMIHNALDMYRNGVRHRIFHAQVCGFCDFAGEVCDDRELEKDLVGQREALFAAKDAAGLELSS